MLTLAPPIPTVRRTSQVSGLPVLDPFGSWFLAELERRGMSQAQFAVMSGISDGTIGWWLYHSRPNVRSCYRIAAALQTPAWVVLKAAGHQYDGLRGVPDDDERRAIMRELEQMTTEERRAVLAFVRANRRSDER